MSVVGSAYTNSFTGIVTATTLYDIDSVLDILVTQIPPNNGTLNTVGSLGVDTTDQVGFDIYAVGNLAFASLTNNGFSSLYSINLATGAATLIGAIGAGNLVVGSIAIQQIPEPASIALLGLGLVGLGLARRKAKKA